jgi:hypothetical protein
MHTAKAFFAVHTHGKGGLLCNALLRLSCWRNFAERGGDEAHGKASPLPCGLEVTRTAKSAARQRFQAHGKAWCTAKAPQRTAKLRRTAKALPCDFCATHGKDGFAVRIFAEHSLLCMPAWQRLCRADFGLCRAFRLHGNAQFCRSDVYLHQST